MHSIPSFQNEAYGTVQRQDQVSKVVCTELNPLYTIEEDTDYI